MSICRYITPGFDNPRSVSQTESGLPKPGFLFLGFYLATAFFICIGSTIHAQQLDPNKKISQYIIKNWGVKDGLPQNSVTCITQTSDGYIWFGSYEGLVRYNGRKFTVFNSSLYPQFTSNRISAVCEDDNGYLYIATTREILRFKNGLFEKVPFNKQTASEFIISCQLIKDKYGTLWGLTDANRLYKFGREGFSQIVLNKTRSVKESFYHVCRGGDGLIYLNTHDRLYCYDSGLARQWVYSELLPGERVYGLASNPVGGVYLISDRQMTALPERKTAPVNYELKRSNLFLFDKSGMLWSIRPNLARHTSRGTELFNLTESVGDNIIICSLIDREGNFWLGSDGAGLFRISEPKVNFISKAEGLRGDVVWSVCEDSEGNLWSASMQSILGKITGSKIDNINIHSPVERMSFISLYPLKKGGIAFASSTIYSLDRTGKISPFAPAEKMKNLQSLYQDESGGIWAGSVGQGLYHFENNKVIHLDVKSGILHGYVSAIIGDGKNGVWIGSRGGLQQITSNRITHSYTTADGLSDDWVRALYLDKSGVLWIGTDNGLNKLEGGKITKYSTAEGLYNNVFHTILEDNKSNLWFSCNVGIYSVSKDQFYKLEQKQIAKLSYRLFTGEDGLKSVEGNGSTQPAGWKTRDGRLIFAMSKGIAIINPDDIKVNNTIPPVIIENITVDDSTLIPGDPQQPLKLEPGNHNISFSYACLSYTNPARNNFMVFLKGFDSRPRIVGEINEISYTNLPPGEYTFLVQACNNDGIWNRIGKSVSIIIPKPFYQTSWFVVPAALLLLTAVGYSAYKASQIMNKRRMRQMEQEIKLERERARISRDIHDEVGSSLTKISILSELAMRHHTDMAKLRENLKKISSLSRQAITNVGEIVWAMNPRNDSLENFAAYIREYIQEELEDSGINCEFIFPEDVPEIPFSSDNRRNLFLIIKESVNNCVKHSHGTELRVKLETESGHLKLKLKDNGVGFNQEEISASGNGLANMKERAALMGAELEIKSRQGEGTETIIDCINTTFI